MSTPGRSLISVKPLPVEDPGMIRVLLGCDCGTATDLTIAIDGELRRCTESAFTCDGCGTAHWFTVGPGGKDGAA